VSSQADHARSSAAAGQEDLKQNEKTMARVTARSFKFMHPMISSSKCLLMQKTLLTVNELSGK
jgi:hypothetical protein